MKEQVILERDEYLKLKESADKTQKEIEEIEKKIKSEFLTEIYESLRKGMKEGYDQALYNCYKDWNDTDKLLSELFGKIKRCIYNGGYNYALSNLKIIAQTLTKNYRQCLLREIMIKEGQEKIAGFNSMPWYKRLFCKA